MKSRVSAFVGVCVVLLAAVCVSAVTFTLYYDSAGDDNDDGSEDTTHDAVPGDSGGVWAIVPDDTCPSGAWAWANFTQYSTEHHPTTTGYYDVDYNFDIKADIGKEGAGDQAYVRVLCIIEQELSPGLWNYVDADHQYFYGDIDASRAIQFDDVWIHNYYDYRVRIVNHAYATIGSNNHYAHADAGQSSYEVDFDNAEFTYDHG